MVNQVSHLQRVGASAAKLSKGIGNARHLTSHFSARTKTTALVTHALAPTFNELKARRAMQPFFAMEVMITLKKKNGMMVRFWDSKLDKIDTRTQLGHKISRKSIARPGIPGGSEP